jgi:hypothetical protein
MLPRGNKMKGGKVTSRKKDHNGNPIGKSNTNPILDTRIYDVLFGDGSTGQYAENVIAKQMYSQVDSEGHSFAIMDDIIDHKKNESLAVSSDDQYIVSPNGRKSARKTTKGWQLCVQWKDGSTSWVDLKDLKESNPFDIAEYAVSNKLVTEPAFAWWVPFTLKKRDCIIAAVSNRFLKKTHKFGIEIPRQFSRPTSLMRKMGIHTGLSQSRKK